METPSGSCEVKPRSKRAWFWQPFFNTALGPRDKPEDDGRVFQLSQYLNNAVVA